MTCPPSTLTKGGRDVTRVPWLRGEGEIKMLLILVAVILALLAATWFFQQAEQGTIVIPTPNSEPPEGVAPVEEGQLEE